MILNKPLKGYYSGTGAPAKPIRMMVGLLLLKQLENLSDENIVYQWKLNSYYQVFCGQTSFSLSDPQPPKFKNPYERG